MVFMWIMSALIFVLLEMGNPGLFYFLSLTLGSGIAAGLAFFELSLTIQVSGFLLGGILGLWLISQFFKRSFTSEVQRTNVYRLIGKQAVVTKQIDALKFGAVKCDGQEWLAKSQEKIEVNQTIEITEISGCHVIVKTVTSYNGKDLL